ncbi:hypothetical protein LEL_07101 [Akanthomyces lecanii RCEF 1005]|uniref:Uncharacterized protein n=1 Tax=Akanthomyces lecanii RCEF 1005 TaxID=1081108 RepID=A0A168FFH4_CORDF|nr:hypothetical protein LEL_07101 [Akanthomyces lecanii RCEF 1005]
MPLYTCPGCKKPISESQPLDHCLQCEAMNERQRARNRTRSESVSEATETTVQCTIITIIFRRPSQQYSDTSATSRPSDSPPRYEDVFQWEAETTTTSSGLETETNASSRRGTTVTLPINIRRA